MMELEINKKYIGCSVAFRYKGVLAGVTISEQMPKHEMEMLMSINHPAVRKVEKKKKDDKQ